LPLAALLHVESIKRTEEKKAARSIITTACSEILGRAGAKDSAGVPAIFKQDALDIREQLSI